MQRSRLLRPQHSAAFTQPCCALVQGQEKFCEQVSEARAARLRVQHARADAGGHFEHHPERSHFDGGALQSAGRCGGGERMIPGGGSGRQRQQTAAVARDMRGMRSMRCEDASTVIRAALGAISAAFRVFLNECVMSERSEGAP